MRLLPGEEELDTDSLSVESWYGEEFRKVTLQIGKEYVVQPMNKLKQKHRGRHCILLGFLHNPTRKYQGTAVRFLNNN